MVEFQEEPENVTEEIAKDEEYARKLSDSRPEISHLADALKDGVFVLGPKDKLVIERVISGRWFDTRTYEIREMNPENGNLKLYDHEYEQFAMSNFKDALARGYTLKVAPLKGRVALKRRRRRSSKRVESNNQTKKKKPSTRRVYDQKGTLCIYLKGIPFHPTGESAALDGERLEVTKPDDKGRIQVKHPSSSWTENWASDVQQ